VHSRLSALLEQQPLPAAARVEALRQEQAVCELRIVQLRRSKVGHLDFVGKAFSKGIVRYGCGTVLRTIMKSVCEYSLQGLDRLLLISISEARAL
jgi:hypothetical protein